MKTSVCVAMALAGLRGVAAQADLQDFGVTTVAPADGENVFCGFIAPTNAVKRWCEPLEWPKLTTEQKAALVEENAEALALFAAACRRPKWYQAPARCGGAFLLFPISDFLQMTKLLDAKAESHIERGEIGAAVECAGDLMSLSRTIQADAETAVCWLVADAGLGFACDIAAHIVASGNATDGELRGLLVHLSGLDDTTRRAGLRQMVNNEFRFCFENGLRIFEEEFHKRRTGIMAMLYRNFIYNPARTKRIYMEWLVKAKDALSGDYDKKKWRKLERELETATKLPESRLRRLSASNSMGRIMLATLAPAWENIAIKVACGDFDLRAAQVVVAAHLYKRKNGDFPDSLDALVPEFLPSVPKDPFGQGAALSYDKSRGIVWSVGENGNFNGEKLPDKDTYGRNFKYVTNLDGTPTYQPERRTP